jgi:AbiJ N-terminal domain 4
MSTFGERYGYKPVRSAIQRESMDDALRNALWDSLTLTVFSDVNRTDFRMRRPIATVKLAYLIWNAYFKKPIDTIPGDWFETEALLRNSFMTARWYEAYSFIEFVVKNSEGVGQKLKALAQTFMKREMAAYRFVNNEIIEITSEDEIHAIEFATKLAAKPIATHLASALALLSDKKNPDYRNSVKESISAVEAAAQLLTGDKTATLGKALKALPHPLHPAFESALAKLYGYTSDANGVRHALSDESTIDVAEARFMLIACSAFVNLLRERANSALP